MKQTVSSTVRMLMGKFAQATGLAPAGTPRRYLWTDAFAVCNYLGLYESERDEQHLKTTLRLIDQVHATLGRHRTDDLLTGWISGLSEQEGRLHPTTGGLRIGKKMNERRHSDPPDESLEWEQDGQYYHYLTKWMHALCRTGRVSGNPVYLRWAMELAKTAHARFTYMPHAGGPKRMYWKMSIDLSYPLVPSMGHHDPLDGLITCGQLCASAKEARDSSLPDLTAETHELAEMCRGRSWTTDDPLGLGELLSIAFKAAQLIRSGTFGHDDLLPGLLDSALSGFTFYMKRNELGLPSDYRLAFRELGLSIGLGAVERLALLLRRHPGCFRGQEVIHKRVAALTSYLPIKKTIEEFWLDDGHHETENWSAHRDINMVMLATSLAPDGYLAS